MSARGRALLAGSSAGVSQENPSVFGFLGNVVGDVGEFAQGIVGLGGSILHDVGVAGAKLWPGEQGIERGGFQLDDIIKALPGAIAGDYSARYGGQGIGEVGHQLYSNPLSYLLDALALGSVVGKGAQLGGRAAIAGTAAEDLARTTAKATGSVGAGIRTGLDALLAERGAASAPLGLARRLLPEAVPRLGPRGEILRVAQMENPVSRVLLERPFRRLTTRPIQALEAETADLARRVAMLGDQAPQVLRNDLAGKVSQLAAAKSAGITRLDRAFVAEQELRRATQRILGDLNSQWLRHREADVRAVGDTLKPYMAADATFVDRAHGVFQRLEFDPTAAPVVEGGGGVTTAVRTLGDLDEATRTLASQQLPEVLARVDASAEPLRAWLDDLDAQMAVPGADEAAVAMERDLGRRYLDSLYEPVRRRLSHADLDPVEEAMEDMRLVAAELWQRPMMEAGVLSPGRAFERSYRPLGLQLRRYDPKIGWDSPTAVAEIDDAMRAAGKSAPIYFPHMKVDDLPKLFDYFRSTRRIGAAKLAEPGYLKRNDLRLFASKSYVTDTMEVYIRRAARAVRYEETMDYLDTVARDLARPISSVDELRSAELVFSPDFVRRVSRGKLAIDDTVDDLISAGREADDALAEAVQTATEEAQAELARVAELGPEALEESLKGMKLYAIPKTAATQIEGRFAPRLGVYTRLFWDGPLNVWRAWVLSASPRWIVNNILGNTLFAKMQGARLRDVVGVMTGRYERMLRDMGPEGEAFLSDMTRAKSGFARLEQQYIPQLGRAGEHPVGQFYQRLQATRPVRAASAISGHMRNLNAVVEDAFRQASFLRAAERQAAIADLRVSGRLFLSSHQRLSHLAEHGMTEGEMTRALAEVNRFFGDYARLSPFERNVIRRFMVPFWSFYKHQAKLLARFPVEMPGRAEVLTALGETSNEMNEQFGPVPEWLEGAVPIGAGPSGTTFLSMRGPDPFSASFQPLTSVLSPPIKMALEQSMGRSLFTGRAFTDENVVYPFGSDQPWRIIRDEAGQVVDVTPIERVAPNPIEHLLQQIPQYQGLKQAFAGGKTYDTATLLDVLQGKGVIREETGEPSYETSALQQLLKLSGVSTYDYDLAGYQEGQAEERKRALAAALSRYYGGS